MKDFVRRISSRKFLAFVSTLGALLALAALNAGAVEVIVGGIVAAFAAYTGSQAHVDANKIKAQS
jgi:hypothetical protein